MKSLIDSDLISTWDFYVKYTPVVHSFLWITSHRFPGLAFHLITITIQWFLNQNVYLFYFRYWVSAAMGEDHLW